jgi:hypothetical protein
VKTRVFAAGLMAAAIFITSSAPAGAWGLNVHRWITERAIDGLPQQIRPFFQSARAFIVEHSVDPDLWRVVGLSGPRGEEGPNHYLDIDGLDEPPPFTKVPREWDAYVARYGVDRANRMGRVPWHVEDLFRRLVTTFQDIGKPTAPYAADNAHYLVAVLAHYVEDVHVPLHATINHNGQETNQRGVHGRFETDLVLRYRREWALRPVTIRPIANVRDYIFDTLVESHALVAPLLEADRRAAAAHPDYGDAYYAAFREGAGAIVERRLSDAASGVASVVTSAWDAAGRPRLPAGRTPEARPGR